MVALLLFLLNCASSEIGMSDALVLLGDCAISLRTVMNHGGWLSLV